jgi:hypothetical protein
LLSTLFAVTLVCGAEFNAASNRTCLLLPLFCTSPPQQPWCSSSSRLTPWLLRLVLDNRLTVDKKLTMDGIATRIRQEYQVRGGC